MFDVDLIAITYYTVMAIFSYVHNKMRKKITYEVTVSLERYVELENKVKELCTVCKSKDAQIDFLLEKLTEKRSNPSNQSGIDN